jgi:hypothetical protein
MAVGSIRGFILASTRTCVACHGGFFRPEGSYEGEESVVALT